MSFSVFRAKQRGVIPNEVPLECKVSVQISNKSAKSLCPPATMNASCIGADSERKSGAAVVRTGVQVRLEHEVRTRVVIYLSLTE